MYNEAMGTPELVKKTLRIDGMTCINCQARIGNKLKGMDGITDSQVSYENGRAEISYDPSLVSWDEIKAAVESLGYRAAEYSGSFEPWRVPLKGVQIAGAAVIIIALYMLLRMFSMSSIAASFPTAQEGMGYGMLLVIGLLTSVHCVGMCGGINLSQTLRRNGGIAAANPQGADSPSLGAIPSSIIPSVLYNGGRLLSYTLVGFAVGALGSIITLSGRFQGAVQLIAGVFMLIMGINMLGLFPGLRRFMPHMPKVFAQRVDEQKIGKGPLVVGILNGFMPCGPLQAMQLYALSTGSPVRGGISMFLFCLGTIPLMFALGAASGILSGTRGQTFSRRVMQAGAVLVSAMGLTMFASGWGLTGLQNPVGALTSFAVPASMRTGGIAPEIRDGVQIVDSTLLPNRYPEIAVQQGIPVRWTINAPQGSINGCNNRMIIREYGIEHTFTYGSNVIEFVPSKTGRFSYSCWMGMIRSSITVFAEGETVPFIEPDAMPVPAGVDIPVDMIAMAEITGNYQMVNIRLTNDGFEPALVVLQRFLPALWNIHIDSLDPGNEHLIVPAYFAVLETGQGDNPIQLMPEEDFDFSTGDNVFYGFVKVVDDIDDADIDAIKAEVAVFETLVYPDTHFDFAGGGGCACCQ